MNPEKYRSPSLHLNGAEIAVVVNSNSIPQKMVGSGQMRVILIKHLAGQYPQLLRSAGVEDGRRNSLVVDEVKIFEVGSDKAHFDFAINFRIDRQQFLYSGLIDCHGAVLYHNVTLARQPKAIKSRALA